MNRQELIHAQDIEQVKRIKGLTIFKKNPLKSNQ